LFESRQDGIFATLQFIVGFFLFSFSFANTTDKGDQKKASKNLKEDWELLFDDIRRIKSGHILLTDHNDTVYFKDIKIRRL